MLEVSHVKKSYKGKMAVDDISFELKKGEVLGLLGANGVGKSTTLSIIATLVKPDSGDVIWEGKSIIKSPGTIRKVLGYVPQDIALYENLSGLDNLKFWGRAYDLKGENLKSAIGRISDMIGLTGEQLKQRINTYSGGMKRRLNIAAAMLHQPKLVVMDEPTVGLDVVSRKAILEAIKNIHKEGTSIIYTGHYLDEVQDLCNHIVILEQGKIIVDGLTQELLDKNDSLEQYYLKAIEV